MNMKIRERIIKLLFQYDWGIIELQSALLKFSWGVLLLIHFHDFSSSRAAGAYSALGPLWAWGLGLTMVGAAHVVALTFGEIKWRRAFLMVAITFWLFNAVILWILSKGTFGGTVAAGIAFFLIINYWRLGLVQHIKNG